MVLQRLIVVLEAAQEARDSMPGRLTAEMHRAQERIERHFGLVDAVSGNVQRRARKTSAVAERPAASAHASNPLSNRGVRSEGSTYKSSAKSRS